MDVTLKNQAVVVNYTYWLEKPLLDYQIDLFRLSFLTCKSYGYTINVHCNQAFKELCIDNNIIPDNFFPLEESSEIHFKTFWAYHKIKVYNSRPIGEWHLDIDAVFKQKPIFHSNLDIQTAYLDNPNLELGLISVPENYKTPVWAVGSLEGFNMSAVIFNNDTLKDIYCSHSFSFMKNNNVIDNGWKHMVFVEQASLKQLVEHYKFSYNYIFDETEYYHLGAAKSYLTEKEITDLKNKIKNKIWQLSQVQALEYS